MCCYPNHQNSQKRMNALSTISVNQRSKSSINHQNKHPNTLDRENMFFVLGLLSL
jgi:hypothetical protein